MKITLIRHAESTYNEKRLLQGQIDCELSNKGLNETKEFAKRFPQDFDICFCSPLKRTKQTAKLLLPNLALIYDYRLKERGLGDWEGTDNTDEKQFLLSNKIVPPNGETFEDFYSRLNDFLKMVKQNYYDKKVLVITHAGVIYGMHKILGIETKVINNLEVVAIEY